MDDNLMNEIMTKVQEYEKENKKKSFEKLLSCFDQLYYQHQSSFVDTVPDSFYDSLVDRYSDKWGENWDAKHVGAKGEAASDINKDVRLPFYMGTILKFFSVLDKDGNVVWRDKGKEFSTWKKEFPGPYTLEGKADGISALLIYKRDGNKVIRELFTRGYADRKRNKEGKYELVTFGKNLSRYLNEGRENFSHIPRFSVDDIPRGGMLVVRGELVMKTRTWKIKYSADYANPRNIVSGFVTKKTTGGVSARDIDFVAYQVIVPRGMKRLRQLEYLLEMGFLVVKHKTVTKSELNLKNLNHALQDFRLNTPYEIDGLVVFDDSIPRGPSKKEAMPSAFAFKLNELSAIAEVVGIEWTAARNNALIPVAVYKPVKIGRVLPSGEVFGSTFHRASAFNADFVRKNKIGPGAKILIVKTGDVIPYISNIVTPGIKGDLPDHVRKPNEKYDYIGHPKISYEWGPGGLHSNLHIFATEPLEGAKTKRIAYFFSGGKSQRGLNILGIGPRTIVTLQKHGYDNISAILNASLQDLINVPGLGPVQAKNIYESIRKRLQKPVDLAHLMGAFQIAEGVGRKVAEKILEVYPHPLNAGEDPDQKNLKKIHGIGPETLLRYSEGLPAFRNFIRENPEIIIQTHTPGESKQSKGPLSGQEFVFTGKFLIDGKHYTRTQLEDMVKSLGGEASDKVTRNTIFLVTADKNSGSKKVRDANKLGIEKKTPTEFINFIRKF